MFLEKIFGNLFGIIAIVIFVFAVFVLLILEFLKKKDYEESELVKQDVVETKIVDERVLEKNNVCEAVLGDYEIVEVDGFFKVRKKGSDRTIRKFVTKDEALVYVKEKSNNDWSKNDR